MHDPFPTAGTHASAVTTDPEWPSVGDRWAAAASESLERTRLIEQSRRTDAAVQLRRCCPSATRVLEGLSWRALTRLAANEPVDPNDPDSWRYPDAHARIVLRRHGITGLASTRLTMDAVRALIDGQARADRDAGLDWTQLAGPTARLDPALRRAHARLPIALDDPAIYAYRDDQRRVLAVRLGVAGEQAGDLSPWLLAHADAFDPEDLRCWRIASTTWLALAREQLPAVGAVERPVGLFLAPAERGEGWQLAPVLSLDAIRLVHSLGGRVESDLRAAVVPFSAAGDVLERVNPRTLHAGPNEQLDSAAGLAQALTRELGTSVSAGVAREKYERWGRLLIRRRPCTGHDGSAGAELVLRVLTIAGREFPRRRVGAAPRDEHAAQPSAVMELGEAVQAAIERQLPLLLSSEAAGQLRDSVRVGRMKGRPGALAFTTADGVSASTGRVVAEQAVPELRALRAAGAKVTLDAGARQLLRMTLARPLSDDPILLGRQKQIAALKVVGSGVDASQVGTGKTITTGRALAHRASTTQRFRALVIAEGRLLGQWRDELSAGAPGRGLPPLAPNVELLVLDDRRSIAGQIRAFDRALGQRAGVVLAPNGTLDRHPAELEAIEWHLLIADEALRYANPATDAHQALAQLRMDGVADCWLLTATPRGKSAEQLDMLVGASALPSPPFFAG